VDLKERTFLEPKGEDIDVNQTFLTSILLPKGSRIVSLLGINKDPHWQVNYGTGKDVSSETLADAKEPLQVKWYNYSMIKIPIYRTTTP
jgi:hypothetical protein